MNLPRNAPSLLPRSSTRPEVLVDPKVADACLGPRMYASPMAGPAAPGPGPAATPGPSRAPAVVADHILLLTDGSRLADQAIPYATVVADACGSSRITVLRVLEPSSGSGLWRVDAVEWAMVRAEAEAQLERLVSSMRPVSARVSPVIAEGRAAEQIVHFVESSGVDLVILATHGHGGVNQWAFGSTARKIVARGNTSLLLIPAVTGDPETRALRTVLVPLDCSPRAETVLPLATRIALASDAELVLAHVVPEPHVPQRLPAPSGDLRLARELTARNRSRAEAYLGDLQARMQGQGIRSHTRLCTSDNPAAAVVRVADEEDADLVLLCAHGAACRGGDVYGSVTERISSTLRRPLWIVQDVPIGAQFSALDSASDLGRIDVRDRGQSTSH